MKAFDGPLSEDDKVEVVDIPEFHSSDDEVVEDTAEASPVEVKAPLPVEDIPEFHSGEKLN